MTWTFIHFDVWNQQQTQICLQKTDCEEPARPTSLWACWISVLTGVGNQKRTLSVLESTLLFVLPELAIKMLTLHTVRSSLNRPDNMHDKLKTTHMILQ